MEGQVLEEDPRILRDIEWEYGVEVKIDHAVIAWYPTLEAARQRAEQYNNDILDWHRGTLNGRYLAYQLRTRIVKRRKAGSILFVEETTDNVKYKELLKTQKEKKGY